MEFAIWVCIHFPLCCTYSTPNITEKNELRKRNMTKLVTKGYINHMKNVVYNTYSGKSETDDNLQDYWQHENRVIIASLAHWYICSVLGLQYLVIHIYGLNAAWGKHFTSEPGLFGSKYPRNLVAMLQISHNIRIYEDITHVKLRALIDIKYNQHIPHNYSFLYTTSSMSLPIFRSSKIIGCIQCQ